jgi:hypothetical protein
MLGWFGASNWKPRRMAEGASDQPRPLIVWQTAGTRPVEQRSERVHAPGSTAPDFHSESTTGLLHNGKQAFLSWPQSLGGGNTTKNSPQGWGLRPRPHEDRGPD